MITEVDAAVGECESCLGVAALHVEVLAGEVFVVCGKCTSGLDSGTSSCDNEHVRNGDYPRGRLPDI